MYIGILIAFIGYVFTQVLMEDLLVWYTRAILRLPDWLNKPLGACGVCFTGWLTIGLLLPLYEHSFIGLVTFAGIVSLNMTIVKLLIYVQKT